MSTPRLPDAMGGVVNIITRKNADNALLPSMQGLNLQESNKWGNSSQFTSLEQWSPVDDFCQPWRYAVAHNSVRGSSVTSLEL